jgi:8-oxo-dGTP diphosphatase
VKIVDVAVGILRNDNKVLLAQRPKPKPYQGWWEFPGGKVENNESLEQALKRELKEELGINIDGCSPWIIRHHSYEHASVRLHFFLVSQWSGDVIPQENQNIKWSDLRNPEVTPILEANSVIFKALSLPPIYAITNYSELKDKFLIALKRKIENGLQLIQIREKSLEINDLIDFCKEILRLTKNYDVSILLNSNIELAKDLGLDGVHLNSSQIYQDLSIPKGWIIGASCHTLEDLKIVEEKKYSFALLSPVNKTQSHPELKHMGWEKFKQIVNRFQIPIYALGGMTEHDKINANNSGSIGIASQRAIWN